MGTDGPTAVKRFARDGRVWAVACMLCLGFWHFGHDKQVPAKAWLAQELMQRVWNCKGESRPEHIAWPWMQTWPVARLTARSGEVDLIVLEGGEDMLEFGPGHLGSSALPGQPGNTVIAGHRATHFCFLKYLQPGDEIVMETMMGDSYHYQVVGANVFDSRRSSLMLDTPEATLSLITQYPFDPSAGEGPMRYVVTAELAGH